MASYGTRYPPGPALVSAPAPFCIASAMASAMPDILVGGHGSAATQMGMGGVRCPPLGELSCGVLEVTDPAGDEYGGRPVPSEDELNM